MHVLDLPTPALVIDSAALEHNLATMAAMLPGRRLRPHVKAHKCTALARRQVDHGHDTFTCATPAEVVGMAVAGVGTDLLLANESVDMHRLSAMAAVQDRAVITIAVDSPETVAAAAAAGIRHVLVDVNIGLPRCGVAPEDAGSLADLARAVGLDVRGVMGYEGHLMMVEESEKRMQLEVAVDSLLAAHADVGGQIVSSGGTGTFHLHDRVTEVQAGSYALMDTQYAELGHPFRPALMILATAIHANDRWVVADAGLKAQGMDHGLPSIDGSSVWFCSDEHITFSQLAAPLRVGDRVRIWPAHVDPTMSQHDRVHVIDEEGEVIDEWQIDLRGW